MNRDAPGEPLLYLGVKRATCPTHGHGGCVCCADVRPLSEVRAMTDSELITHLSSHRQDPLVLELVRRLRGK